MTTQSNDAGRAHSAAPPGAPLVRPTVKDVARVAGVSTATVSRVMNQNPHVAEALRNAVLDAVQALGYEKNEAAVAIRRIRDRG